MLKNKESNQEYDLACLGGQRCLGLFRKHDSQTNCEAHSPPFP